MVMFFILSAIVVILLSAVMSVLLLIFGKVAENSAIVSCSFVFASLCVLILSSMFPIVNSYCAFP